MSTAIILGTRPEIIKMSPVIREFERMGMEYFILHTGQGNKAKVIFQTGLTGSAGFVSSFYPIHLSKIKEPQIKAPRVTPLEGVSAQSVLYFNNNKPQMNADERRYISVTEFAAQSTGSIHRKEREERKAKVVFQTGSTGCVISFNQVNPVIVEANS